VKWRNQSEPPLQGDFGNAMRVRFALQWHMFAIISVVLITCVAANFVLRTSLPLLAIRYAVLLAMAYVLLVMFLRLWLHWIQQHFSTEQLQRYRYQPRFDKQPRQGDKSKWDWLDPSGCSGDLDGCLVAMVIMAILALCAVLMWGVYALISDAAIILVDIAAAYLFTRLISHRSLYIGDRNWFGVVLRHTGLPLLSAYGLIAVIAIAAHVKCPHADTIGDLFFTDKCAALASGSRQ
jgi:hypothetical protein